MSSPGNPAPLATTPRAELTLRGLVLGVVITVVFTAGHVYFGLKAGLPFAPPIPAAAISLALPPAPPGMTRPEDTPLPTLSSAARNPSPCSCSPPGNGVN